MPSSHNGHISITGVSKYYGRHKALDDVSLEIPPGTVTVILGPSGSGKSTLLRTINHLERVDEGFIQIDGDYIGYRRKGDKLYEMKEKEILRQRINVGYVFQNFNLFPHLTVLENLIEAPIAHQQVTRKEAIARAYELLDVVGLRNKADAWSRHLSGGQQQRIAIARAIVNEPRLLLLDEPLGALDLKLRQDMQYELIRLKNELGITFIYVTHDQEEALTMSDTIVVMNQGYIQQMGTPEQIYNEPENAFVADFIGESNIVPGIMLRDELVEIFGARFACVDKGFGNNKPVDVVIRPEDIDLVDPSEGTLVGTCTHLIFKGVHYEMEVTTPDGFEWLVHSTDMCPVGKQVGIKVDPFDIQIMNKPESEDEEAVGVNE